MKRNFTTLNHLPLYQKGIIENLNCENTIKRRLLDLGFVSGTEITPILVSPSKDPRAFLVRGSIIAIREDDASSIYVTF